MKRFLILMVAVLMVMVFVGFVYADQKNTGCGLGSMLFKNKDGLVFEVLAVTTNGSFGTSTFGITSGTSNCEKPASFVSNEKVNRFVADNMDNLAKDISRGDGEYLNTLATLIEVPQQDVAHFRSTLQANFSRIYTSDQVSHVDVLRNIETVMSMS